MRQQFTSRGFAICLSLACLFLTGNVLAQGTTATTVVELGDCSPGMPGRVITIPANTVTRTMGVLRGVGGPLENFDFFLDVTLQNGALWDASGPPVTGSLSFGATAAPATYTVQLIGAPAGTATATYGVFITNGTPAAFPTGTFTTTGLAVTDVNNLLAGGGIVPITVSTRDINSGVPIDVGTDTVNWLIIAGASCPPPPACFPDISELTEISMAGALKSEERVVAQLEKSSSRAETIAEIRPRDANSMLADLMEASIAIAGVNFGLDLAEANGCLFAGELLLIRPDILAASALDTYVSSRLGDPFSEVTPQTLLNLMGRAIEHKENVMESLISFGFF